MNQKRQQPENNQVKVKFVIDPKSRPATDLNSKEFIKKVNDDIKMITNPASSKK
jgi:hypothetical protein